MITSGDSVKARLAGRASTSSGAYPTSALSARSTGLAWLTLSGPIRVGRDPDAVANAVRRYAERYRQPRVNPNRVVLVTTVTRLLGHPG